MKKLISLTDYHKHEAIGSTLLKAIAAKSVVHALADEFKESESMLIGNGAHSLILNPEKFSSEFLVMPKVDRRTKAGKETYEAFMLKAEGKSVINEEQLETINGIVRSVLSHKKALSMLTGGEAEYAYFAICPETGLELKCRPDFVNKGALMDLKTCVDASPKGFAKACANYMYHVQAAYYLDVYSMATGIDANEFYFLAAENSKPFGVAAYLLDSRDIDFGRGLYKQALRDLKKYLTEKETGNLEEHSFMYGDQILSLELPNWAYTA